MEEILEIKHRIGNAQRWIYACLACRVVVLLFEVLLITLELVIYRRSKITPEANNQYKVNAMRNHMYE